MLFLSVSLRHREKETSIENLPTNPITSINTSVSYIAFPSKVVKKPSKIKRDKRKNLT
jgi:hypothetical protein